jgi:hypothetical protein
MYYGYYYHSKQGTHNWQGDTVVLSGERYPHTLTQRETDNESNCWEIVCDGAVG